MLIIYQVLKLNISQCPLIGYDKGHLSIENKKKYRIFHLYHPTQYNIWLHLPKFFPPDIIFINFLCWLYHNHNFPTKIYSYPFPVYQLSITWRQSENIYPIQDYRLKPAIN